MTEPYPRDFTGTVDDIPDATLLKRAVETARHRRMRGKHPRYVAVMWTFFLGSTYASQLCERFGFDPKELVHD